MPDNMCPSRLMGDVDNQVIISTVWVHSCEDDIRDRDPYQQELFSTFLEMEGRTSEEVVFEQRPERWGGDMQSAGVPRRIRGNEFHNIYEIWVKHPSHGAQLRKGMISTSVPNQRLPNTSHGVLKNCVQCMMNSQHTITWLTFLKTVVLFQTPVVSLLHTALLGPWQVHEQADAGGLLHSHSSLLHWGRKASVRPYLVLLP